jgi:aryl-alcohol dehydrogenase-like predicted oxidoreductase
VPVGLADRRRLGGSDLEVSPLAVGSWRTYERIPREAGAAVMRAARDVGINFLDDARYNDETGTAPLKTGYSEVVFGELFRAAGWNRDEVVLANKLWWEFWPGETAEAEIDGSLQRMGMDYIDLIYAERPPAGLSVHEIVRQVGGLIAKGKARAWGVLNWRAEAIAKAAVAARTEGVPPPCAVQLAYNLVARSPVEDAEMADALHDCGAGVVASFVMAGGLLTGKYASPAGAGRWSGNLDDADVRPFHAAGAALRELAERSGAAPGTLAIAFALQNPIVTTVLFGSTTAEQVRENARAVELASSLDPAVRKELDSIGR